MSLHASLVVHGIRLIQWHLMPTEPAWRKFHHGVFDGMVHLTDGQLQIVALMTDSPGTGLLGTLFDRFEAAADDASAEVCVCEIWNDRLAAWLARRGYELGNDPEMGRFARRKTPVGARI